MLQSTKVSFATLLSTFYSYFASDALKCINYCMHCRKLKCIHYYSYNFRLFAFYYKSNSICKTFTAYNPCRYVDMPLAYSLMVNTTTQFLGRNLLRNLFGILLMCNIVWFQQYSINYLSLIYMNIF